MSEKYLTNIVTLFVLTTSPSSTAKLAIRAFYKCHIHSCYLKKRSVMWAKWFEISAMDVSDCIPQVRHHFPTIGKGFLYYAKTTCIALLQPSLLAVFSTNCRIPLSVCLISLNSLSRTVSIKVLLWSLLSWYDSTLVCRSFLITGFILPVTYMFHPGI